jgi:hypothetical protein
MQEHTITAAEEHSQFTFALKPCAKFDRLRVVG